MKIRKPHLAVSLGVVTAMVALTGVGSATGNSPASATVTIVEEKARVEDGRASIRLSCTRGENVEPSCKGSLVLRKLGADRSGYGQVLGHAAFGIGYGGTQGSHIVRVELNRRGQRLVERRPPVRVNAIARLYDGKTNGERVVEMRDGNVGRERDLADLADLEAAHGELPSDHE